jgi:sugar phosphate permease
MRWRIIPLLMLVIALAHFNRVSISVAGVWIIDHKHLSETEMGLVYSAFLVVYTLCMTPGGWFIDRFGPRAGWLLLLFGSAAGAALTGLVGLTYTQGLPLLVGLLIARPLMGMTNSPLHPSGARLVANWLPPRGHALANGLLNGAACVGIASTYVVFGRLIDAFGWPQAFLYAAGATFVIAQVWLIAGSNYPPELRAPVRADRADTLLDARAPGDRLSPGVRPLDPGRFRKLLVNPSLLWLTLSYGTVGYFEYLFFYWAEYYFKDVLHLPREVSRANASLLDLAMGGGMIVGGWLADRAVIRFGTRPGLAAVPVGGLLLGAAATCAGLLTASPNLIFLSIAVAMAAVGSVEGAYWTAAVRIGGTRGGTAAAILNTGGNAVGLLAPVVSPALGQIYGWNAVLVLASVVCVFGAAMWWGVTATGDPDDTPDEKQSGSGSWSSKEASA